MSHRPGGNLVRPVGLIQYLLPVVRVVIGRKSQRICRGRNSAARIYILIESFVVGKSHLAFNLERIAEFVLERQHRDILRLRSEAYGWIAEKSRGSGAGIRKAKLRRDTAVCGAKIPEVLVAEFDLGR